MTGSSHKTFPGPQGDLISDSDDEKIHRRLNSGIFQASVHPMPPPRCGKAIALSEFEEYGQAYSADIVANAKALGELSPQRVSSLAEDRGIQRATKSSPDMEK